MPLVSMNRVLAAAAKEGYAVGAFNPVDYASMKAIVCAAEEENAPVILQTSAKTVRYYGHEALAMWMRELAEKSTIPVVLHLDHGKELEMIRRCIETGWTSVMIDASHLPFEQNLAMSREVVEMATAAGVGVEAELGEIVGVEEDISVSEEDAHLADPDKAEIFCRELELGVFAPAIGTGHGFYKGTPNVAFDLIEEIYRRTATPLALHGGTGLSDEIIQRCIRSGCAKVNISTQLKHAFVDGFSNYHKANPDDYEPLKVLGAQFEFMKQLLRKKIRQFGGSGKGRKLAAVM
jgi:ketose-bisphosphate aldolase